MLHTFFTLRISSSVSFFNCRKDQSFRIFFTSNVLLIQVCFRSGNSQSLVTVVLPVYKLCMIHNLLQRYLLAVREQWQLRGLHTSFNAPVLRRARDRFPFYPFSLKPFKAMLWPSGNENKADVETGSWL